MTRMIAGILLPSSILSSQAFAVLALVVAFNTIIYVGLTVSKLIPWPQQFHPQRVRRWLSLFGYDAEAMRMTDVSVPRAETFDDPYIEIRRSTAQRDIPLAFGLFGGVIVLIGSVSLIIVRDSNAWALLLTIAFGVLYLLLAALIRRWTARTVVAAWIVSSTVLAVGLTIEAGLSRSIWPLAIALVLITASASVALVVRATVIASVVELVVVVAVTSSVDELDAIRISLVAVAAMLVGQVLLRLRLVSLDALVTERLKSGLLVATDPLTGLFTPASVLILLPTLVGMAQRLRLPVSVVVVAVPAADRAIEEYGNDYGDALLQAVGEAVRGCARMGDLAARWERDRFVVVWTGLAPSPQAFSERINAAVVASGVTLGKWPVDLEVGVASGAPGATTFNGLVERAAAEIGSSQ